MQPSSARRCPKCAGEVREGWRVCPACAAPLEPADAETETMFAASSAGTIEEGRFPAGTVLAGRYRVLGLIGHGGMGEVYRAYDLILNQAVALKFLGRGNMDEAALARFRNEVRVARQVSHPNVCRVYDIGFIEGFHFLSMEYLDGDDLASLLRRIGRLPQDKAIEFGRKICAGLAAAHERGVLHRDLKPANIMIDGRGQVRITDFGLAALAQEVALSDIRSGTPAYMSPEQKAGKEVTTRSDLYSLGLVLYEMFTGKRRGDTQTNPSELVKDLDPAVERVILRCLEQDPKRRPSSALNVAMALPGGDPIAAALAAGETPSPEMVAASGEKEGFSPRTAWLCFAAAVVLAVIGALVSPLPTLLNRVPLETPPDGMAFRAQDLLKQLGYTQKPKTTAYGFDYFETGYLRYLQDHKPPNPDELLATGQPAIMGFWYRQHQDVFYADRFLEAGSYLNGNVSYNSPANTEPGMIRLILDVKGRLFALEARPAPAVSGQGSAASDWTGLFAAAGLDLARFTPTAPEQIPPMAFDARQAWTGTFAEGRPERARVEAASWRGRPVYFKISGDWSAAPAATGGNPVIPVVLLATLLIGSAIVAWRNLRLGRGDRRGAAQIAAAALVILICEWIPVAEHVARFWEVHLIVSQLSFAVFSAGALWLLYVAIEPYVRRNWPDALISWTRLQAGRVRDPLVASHILAGICAAFALILMYFASSHMAGLQGNAALPPLFPLNSVAMFFSSTVFLIWYPLPVLIGFMLVVVLFRLLIRRVWIADTLGSVLLGALFFNSANGALVNGVNVAMQAFAFYALVWSLRRFGLLAPLALAVGAQIALSVPFNASSWYAGRALVAWTIPVAVAAWALWAILSAQRRPAADSAHP
jgi:Protein kinase domain